MNVLVVGYGSIGSRHARILKELGCSVTVVSGRENDFKPSFRTIGEAMRSSTFDYSVVANRTSDHLPVMEQLEKEGFLGTVLVEKPLFAHTAARQFQKFKRIYVGYNLRFHPALQKLRESLKGEKIISAQCYVGKYLPDWRPGTDYKRSYSADRQAGGGVLRDLSHELDYLSWILGPLKEVTALGGHYSHLEIDADDTFCLMMATECCPMVTLHTNYLDRKSRREIVVNTDRHTFRVDLTASTLELDGQSIQYPVEWDSTYRLEHQAVINGAGLDSLCSYKEGADILRWIEAAEKAAKERVWVTC